MTNTVNHLLRLVQYTLTGAVIAVIVVLSVEVATKMIDAEELPNIELVSAKNVDCKLNDHGQLLGNQCAPLLNYRDKFLTDIPWTEAQFAQNFKLEQNDKITGYKLVSVKKLVETIDAQNLSLAKLAGNEIKELQGKYIIAGEFKAFTIIDLEATMANFHQKVLDYDYLAVSYPIVKKQLATAPAQINNKQLIVFSQKISSGEARVSASEKLRVANLKEGLDKLNGVLVSPRAEFSLLDTLGATLYKKLPSGDYVATNGEDSNAYGYGICGASTATYRAALLGGFKITERKAHYKEYSNYLFPYGGLLDAAVYFDVAAKTDLKFLNDSDSHLYMVSNYETRKDGNLYYKVEIYAESSFQSRMVELKDFKRFNQNSKGFTESFTRVVDGKPATATSRYSWNR